MAEEQKNRTEEYRQTDNYQSTTFHQGTTIKRLLAHIAGALTTVLQSGVQMMTDQTSPTKMQAKSRFFLAKDMVNSLIFSQEHSL